MGVITYKWDIYIYTQYVYTVYWGLEHLLILTFDPNFLGTSKTSREKVRHPLPLPWRGAAVKLERIFSSRWWLWRFPKKETMPAILRSMFQFFFQAGYLTQDELVHCIWFDYIYRYTIKKYSTWPKKMKTHQKKSEKNTRNTHKQKQRKQPKLQSLDLPFPMTKNPAVSLVQVLFPPWEERCFTQSGPVIVAICDYEKRSKSIRHCRYLVLPIWGDLLIFIALDIGCVIYVHARHHRLFFHHLQGSMTSLIVAWG